MDNTNNGPFNPQERIDQLNNHTPSTKTMLNQAGASIGLGAAAGVGIASYRDFENVKLRLSGLSSKSSSAMKDMIDNHPSLLECVSTNASEFLNKLYELCPAFMKFNMDDYIKFFNESILSINKIKTTNIFVAVIKSFISMVLRMIKLMLTLVKPIIDWVTNLINAPFPGTEIVNGVPRWSYGKMFVLVGICAAIVWCIDKVRKSILSDDKESNREKTESVLLEENYFALKTIKESCIQIDHWQKLAESSSEEESLGVPPNINIIGNMINGAKARAKNVVINLTVAVRNIAQKNTSKIMLIMLGILTCGFVLNWLSIKPTTEVKETIGKQVLNYLKTTAVDATRGVGEDPSSWIDPKLLKGLSGGIAAGAVSGAIVDKPLEGSAIGAAGGLVMTAMGLVV